MSEFLDKLKEEHATYEYPMHLKPAMNSEQRLRTIQRAIQMLQPHNFDTLAFSGISGSSIGFILAHILNKEVISVRQPGVMRRAGGRDVEGYRKAQRYIIVDDLISTGKTVARVIRGVRQLAFHAQCVGALLYYNQKFIVPTSVYNNSDDSYAWRSVEWAIGEMDKAEAAGKRPEEV
jgi:orotate phosphoribosyltransferase